MITSKKTFNVTNQEILMSSYKLKFLIDPQRYILFSLYKLNSSNINKFVSPKANRKSIDGIDVQLWMYKYNMGYTYYNAGDTSWKCHEIYIILFWYFYNNNFRISFRLRKLLLLKLLSEYNWRINRFKCILWIVIVITK